MTLFSASSPLKSTAPRDQHTRAHFHRGRKLRCSFTIVIITVIVGFLLNYGVARDTLAMSKEEEKWDNRTARVSKEAQKKKKET